MDAEEKKMWRWDDLEMVELTIGSYEGRSLSSLKKTDLWEGQV